jgi:hypothetical protein
VLVTDEGVGDILRRLFRVALITIPEDRLLYAAGLRDRMPDEWDGIDPFARYRLGGISLVPDDPAATSRTSPRP